MPKMFLQYIWYVSYTFSQISYKTNKAVLTLFRPNIFFGLGLHLVRVKPLPHEP